MRRCFLFLVIAGVVALVLASNELPFETLKALALQRAQLRWGEVAMGPVAPGYDLNGQPSVYIFTFRIGSSVFPADDEIEAMIEQGKELELQGGLKHDRILYQRGLDLKFGVGLFGKVVVGARYDKNPIYVIGNSLPPHYYNRSRADERARQYLGSAQVRLVRVYYLTPLNEFFEYTDGERSVLINCYSLQKIDREDYLGVGDSKVSLRPKWDALLKEQAYPERFDGYVPNVPAVPLWSYGCTPTASAMSSSVARRSSAAPSA